MRDGDVFRLFRRRPEMIDVTPEGGKGPRTFGLMEVDKDYVGQDEKVAAAVQSFVERSFPPPEVPGLTEYAYTMEELRYIGETIGEEQVAARHAALLGGCRGRERTCPPVLGRPARSTTVKSYMATPDFLMAVTPREWLLMGARQGYRRGVHPRPDTDCSISGGGSAGQHWSNRAAHAEGEPLAFLFAKLSRLLMCRCVTNWMGDDGWLASYRWRHVMRTPVGDTLVARGQR